MYIGIDVSKATLAVAQKQENGKIRHFDVLNKEEKIKAFLCKLDVKQHTLVMEYTGTYHRRLLELSTEKGFSVCMVCPRESANFSKMKNNISKTDKQDAALLLKYAEMVKPSIYQPKTEKIAQMKQKRVVLSQLEKQKHDLLNVQESFDQIPHSDQSASDAIQSMLKCINEQIEVLEKELCDMSTQTFEKRKKRAMTVKGIGEKVATQLLIITNGLEDFDTAKQLSKFLGISPTTYESGSSVRGKGHISKSGNPKLRSMLYVASWSAIRHNKACADLYARLKAQGKASKVALVAVMHKLVRQVFAVVKSGVDFEDDYVPVLAHKS